MKGTVAVYQGPGQPMEFREYPLPEVGPARHARTPPMPDVRWSAKFFGSDEP